MRIAIVAIKNLTAGQVANCAAVLCGQLASLNGSYFGTEPVIDRTGGQHAAVKYSVAVLEANGSEQLTNTAKALGEESQLTVLLFSKTGQQLNDAFAEYEAVLKTLETADSGVVAMLVAGPSEVVKAATKKFSLFN